MVPVVHSTVNVAAEQGPTIPRTRGAAREGQTAGPDLGELLGGHRVHRRRGRDRPPEAYLLCALNRGVHGFTALDALRDGYEVYPVVDAVGGTSPEAHRAGLDRVFQAGGQPISRVPLACELQRDWARQETVADVVQIVLTDRLRKE